MERLLLLEDDLALGEGVRLALQSPSRPVTLCRDLAQARQTLAGDGPFALAILDVNLPDGSGLSLLEELRGRVPVILLTANDLETDVVAGLELGAEDYINYETLFPGGPSGSGERPVAPAGGRRPGGGSGGISLRL